MKKIIYINQIISLFMFVSIFGWLMEVTGNFIAYKTFENRGFLFSPFLPIYGFGSILFVLIFRYIKINIFNVFIIGMISSTLLEYTTGYLLETIFNKNWWDYSGYIYNINGKISLLSSIGFGLGGILINYIIFPFVKNIYKKVDNYFFIIINLIFVFYLSFDFLFSIIVNINKVFYL